MSDYCGQEGVCAEAPGCSRHWGERVREVMEERDEARAEVERLRGLLDKATSAHERDLVAVARALGFVHEPPSSAEEVAKAASLRLNERRQLRARLVECRPWVGVCPWPGTKGFTEMLAIRDIADDTLEEVGPWNP